MFLKYVLLLFALIGINGYATKKCTVRLTQQTALGTQPDMAFKAFLQPGGKTALLASTGDLTYRWDLKTLKLKHSLEQPIDELHAARFSNHPSGDRVDVLTFHSVENFNTHLLGDPETWTAAILTFDLASGALIREHQWNNIGLPALSPDGRRLILPTPTDTADPFGYRFSEQSPYVAGSFDINDFDPDSPHVDSNWASEPQQDMDSPHNLHLWNPFQRRMIRDLGQLTSEPEDILISPSNRFSAFTWWDEGKLRNPRYRIVDLNSGLTLREHETQLQGMAFSVKDHYFVAGLPEIDSDQKLLVVNLRQNTSGIVISPINLRSINQIVFSPASSNQLAIASNISLSLGILLTDEKGITFREVTKILTAGRDSLATFAWSPDGNYLAIGYSSGRILIWHLPTQTPVIELHGHDDRIFSLEYSRNGQTLISLSHGETDEGGTAKVWDLNSLPTPLSPSSNLGLWTTHDGKWRIRKNKPQTRIQFLVDTSTQ